MGPARTADLETGDDRNRKGGWDVDRKENSRSGAHGVSHAAGVNDRGIDPGEQQSGSDFACDKQPSIEPRVAPSEASGKTKGQGQVNDRCRVIADQIALALGGQWRELSTRTSYHSARSSRAATNASRTSPTWSTIQKMRTGQLAGDS